MHIMSFSEREYVDVSEDAIIENGSSYFGLPNTNCCVTHSFAMLVMRC